MAIRPGLNLDTLSNSDWTLEQKTLPPVGFFLDRIFRILYNTHMLKKLFESWGRYRIIMDRVDNQPYLERYYVFLRDRERFPFNIFVHKFLKSRY
jgi:hypothetical protein